MHMGACVCVPENVGGFQGFRFQVVYVCPCVHVHSLCIILDTMFVNLCTCATF